MKCDNCGEPIPLRKNVTRQGRSVRKGDRTCPDCGKSVAPTSSRLIEK